LGERLNGIQEVGGSIPLSSTNKIKDFSVSDRDRIGRLPEKLSEFVKGVATSGG
jgi:hypothetical protein